MLSIIACPYVVDGNAVWKRRCSGDDGTGVSIEPYQLARIGLRDYIVAGDEVGIAP